MSKLASFRILISALLVAALGLTTWYIWLRPSEAPQTQIIDLMEALKASLDRGAGKSERKPARAAKKATAAPEKSATTRKRKAAGS